MGVQGVSSQESTVRAASAATRTPSSQSDSPARAEEGSRDVQQGKGLAGDKAEPPEVRADSRLDTRRSGVRIHVDQATDRFVTQILDENRQVVKQIPPEELLDVLAKTRRLNGILFDEEA